MTVSTLIGHRDLNTGLLCLGSMAKRSAEPISFRIHDDGTLSSEDREQLRARIPVSGFVDRPEADSRMEVELHRHPACLAYRSRWIYGLKLFDVPLFGNEADVAYCDSDIFFLRPFCDLFKWPDANCGCLFMQDWQDAYSLRPWHLSERLPMPAKLNSGLFFLRRHRYDLDFIEWLLSRNYGVFQRLFCWLEQTAWAALAWKIHGRFWSEHQIRTIQSDACLNDKLVAGHFTFSVRGLLLQPRDHPNRPVEAVLTEPMKRLRTTQLLHQQSIRLLRRKFAQT